MIKDKCNTARAQRLGKGRKRLERKQGNGLVGRKYMHGHDGIEGKLRA